MKKMNRVKKTLVAFSLTGALVAGAGYGTFSWFTSSAYVSGSIQNGTLEISLKGGIEEIEFLSDDEHSTLAPGRTIKAKPIVFENSGNMKLLADGKLSLDIVQPEHVTNKEALLRQISVTVTVTKNGQSELADEFEKTNGFDIQEVELLRSLVEGLEPGDRFEVTMSLGLDESAGNELQGIGIKPTLTVDAIQEEAK